MVLEQYLDLGNMSDGMLKMIIGKSAYNCEPHI